MARISQPLLIAAVLLTSGCAPADCQSPAIEPLSSALQRYVESLDAATEVKTAPAGVAEVMPRAFDSLRAIENEWAELKTSIPGSRARLTERIDGRISFLRFFTTIAFTGNERISDPQVLEKLQKPEDAERAYLANSERYLTYLESTGKHPETGERIELPRGQFDFKTQKNRALIWAYLAHKTITEFEVELDELCRVLK